jgi:O-methyltransferase
MRFNVCKFLAPDFTIGKIIVTRKSIADSLKLLICHPNVESLRFARLMLKVKPKFTMVTNKNLLTLYKLVQEVNRTGVAGDIVECGVWNGGSAAVMGLADMENTGSPNRRSIWLFDSFQGLPPAGEKDGELERRNYFEGWNKGDVAKVHQVFGRVGVPLTNIKIVPGWFDTTLVKAQLDRIAILHIDADWYKSVKLVLDVFYHKVVPGGFVILNDYDTWSGCNQALAEFLAENNIGDVDLKIVEPSTGAYFQKVDISSGL